MILGLLEFVDLVPARTRYGVWYQYRKVKMSLRELPGWLNLLV